MMGKKVVAGDSNNRLLYHMHIKFTIVIVIAGFLFSCKSDVKKAPEAPLPRAVIPRADADSSFSFIAKQVGFGVRVPGSDGHVKTKDWIVAKMKSYGAEVEVLPFKASFLGQKDLQAYNIVAKINPTHEKRIALFAHWDTRLIAEKDSDPKKTNEPILGAVDGGSGVAGLMEIARLIHTNGINLGVDFVFFDAEDQGLGDDNNWCIGSQKWSVQVAENENKPALGILLDLIGAQGATYYKEGISVFYAKDLVNKVWALANGMNKGQYFKNDFVGEIMDDHFHVNKIAGIPTIDIIETLPSGNFAKYHHTHNDNLTAIDKENLAAVIQVVTAVVYKVSDGTF